ncbi:MAG: hypothetical protein O2855_06175 [Planctomycetota bacterium]|nr:hypothetical protein [Planctomycetota bacterium]
MTAAWADNRSDAEQWLADRGYREGFNPAKATLIFVETGAVTVAPGRTGFVQARQAAYERALGACRTSAAEFLSASVAAAAEARSSEASLITGDTEVYALASGSTATSKVLADAVAAGLSPWQTFEDSDSVTIVAALSPKYLDAIRCRGQTAANGTDARDWVKSLDDDTLAQTLGTRFHLGADGRMQVVAFGQAPVRAGVTEMADREATVSAQGQLALLVSQAIASRSLLESASAWREGSEIPESFAATSGFEDAVKANGRANFRSSVVGRRRVQVGEQEVAVVVVSAGLCDEAEPVPGLTREGRGAAPVAAARDCPKVPENMQASVRAVEATGAGKSYRDAVQSALLDAIQQQGVSVEGNATLKRRFESWLETTGAEEAREKTSASTANEENVSTHSSGMVDSYVVLEKSEADGVHTVTICANLILFDPKNPRFGLPPTAAVIMTCGSGSLSIPGLADPCPRARGVLEPGLTRALRAAGLDVLDQASMRELDAIRDQIANRVAQGRAKVFEGLKLGEALTPDQVLLVELRELKWTAAPGAESAGGIQASDQATASIDAKLVDVSTGRLLWSDSSTVQLPARDLLLVRAGKSGEPAERGMVPWELALSRAGKSLLEKMKSGVPSQVPGAPAGAQGDTDLIQPRLEVVPVD